MRSVFEPNRALVCGVGEVSQLGVVETYGSFPVLAVNWCRGIQVRKPRVWFDCLPCHLALLSSLMWVDRISA